MITTYTQNYLFESGECLTRNLVYACVRPFGFAQGDKNPPYVYAARQLQGRDHRNMSFCSITIWYFWAKNEASYDNVERKNISS